MKQTRIWNKRPDGLSIEIPTSKKIGEFVILEFKRMSDVTDQYVTLAKRVTISQYTSIKSVLEQTLGHQGWIESHMTGPHSLNEKDLQSTLMI